MLFGNSSDNAGCAYVKVGLVTVYKKGWIPTIFGKKIEII